MAFAPMSSPAAPENTVLVHDVPERSLEHKDKWLFVYSTRKQFSFRQNDARPKETNYLDIERDSTDALAFQSHKEGLSRLNFNVCASSARNLLFLWTYEHAHGWRWTNQTETWTFFEFALSVWLCQVRQSTWQLFYGVIDRTGQPRLRESR